MPWEWKSANRPRPVLVMGVLNTSPDSFSDGGQFTDPELAVAHGLRMEAEGADVVDVGGASTRPGSIDISTDEELSLVLPVVERLTARLRVPVSIDTSNAEVAEAALRAGARIVNDITALRRDPAMGALVARYDAGLVLMHMKGTPATMQDNPQYDDVVDEVKGFLADRVRAALDAGVSPQRIAVDPGIGFGKTVDHNLELIRHIAVLRALGYPVLIGPSRKRFIGMLLDLPVTDRLEGTLATCAVAVAQGADAVRVHDVAPVRRAVDLAVWLRSEGGNDEDRT